MPTGSQQRALAAAERGYDLVRRGTARNGQVADDHQPHRAGAARRQDRAVRRREDGRARRRAPAAAARRSRRVLPGAALDAVEQARGDQEHRRRARRVAAAGRRAGEPRGGRAAGGARDARRVRPGGARRRSAPSGTTPFAGVRRAGGACSTRRASTGPADPRPGDASRAGRGRCAPARTLGGGRRGGSATPRTTRGATRARTFYPRTSSTPSRSCPRTSRAARRATSAAAAAGGRGARPAAAAHARRCRHGVRVIAAVLRRSPGAPRERARQQRLERRAGARRSTHRARARGAAPRERAAGARFPPDVAAGGPRRATSRYMEREGRGRCFAFWWLDGRQRAIRARWTALPAAGVRRRRSSSRRAEHARRSTGCAASGRRWPRRTREAATLFGALWQGSASDWDALDAIRAMGRGAPHARVVRHGLADRRSSRWPRVQRRTSDARPTRCADAERRRARCAATELRAARRRGRRTTCSAAPFDGVAGACRAPGRSAPRGPRWARSSGRAQAVARRRSRRELLAAALAGERRLRRSAARVPSRVLFAWLADVVQARPAAARGSRRSRTSSACASSASWTGAVLAENRARARRLGCATRVQAAAARATRVEAAHARSCGARWRKQRNHAPLRRDAARRRDRRPRHQAVFLMSPLSVAQFLEGGAPDVRRRDLRRGVAAAAGGRRRRRSCAARSSSSSATRSSCRRRTSSRSPHGQAGGSRRRGWDAALRDAESMLEEFMGCRRAHEPAEAGTTAARTSRSSPSRTSSFYDARPAHLSQRRAGSRLARPPFELRRRRRVRRQGAQPGRGAPRRRRGRRVRARAAGGASARRAGRVARRRHLQPAPAAGRSRTSSSSGGATTRRSSRSSTASAPEPFFVKNLENIQGDERDVIFLSVTYAKGRDGRLRYNFGPLNGENGWRRLNVLTTRARRSMRVFSSMRGQRHQRRPAPRRRARAAARVPRVRGARAGSIARGRRARRGTESPFEREVVERARRGAVHRCSRRSASPGYRIDIGVRRSEPRPAGSCCGIECDGVGLPRLGDGARPRPAAPAGAGGARLDDPPLLVARTGSRIAHGQIDRIVRLVEEAKAQSRTRAEAAPVAAAGGVSTDAAAVPVAGSPPARPTADGAEREAATPYVFAGGEARYTDRDLLAEPPSTLADAIASVVEVESPVHVDDVIARVAAMWDTRAGTRIQSRILDACTLAERQRVVERRGDFLWEPGREVVVRSRAGTRSLAERIAPEEYRAAVMMVLDHGRSFARPALVNEVRSVLGFSRTGASLDEAIGAVLDGMLTNGVLGEGSTGIRRR